MRCSIRLSSGLLRSDGWWAGRGVLVLLQENRWERGIRQAIRTDQRPGRRAPKGGHASQKARQRLTLEGGLRNRQHVVRRVRSGEGGDQHLAGRPGRAVSVAGHAELLAAATTLLDAHAPVNMPDIISKEGQMAEGKCHVEIVYCVV